MERYIETLLKLEKSCKELKKDAIALLYEEGEMESPIRGLSATRLGIRVSSGQ